MELPNPAAILAQEEDIIPHPSFPIDLHVTIDDVSVAKRKLIGLIKEQVLSGVMENKRLTVLRIWPKDDKPIVLHKNITDMDLINYESDWSELCDLFERNLLNSSGHYSVEVVGRDKKHLSLSESS